MERISKISYRQWLAIIIAWIVLIYLYFFWTFVGIKDLLQEGIVKDYLSSWRIHLEILMSATFFGFLFALIHTITDKTTLRKKPFGFIIFFKSVLYLVSLWVVILAVHGLFYYFEVMPKQQLSDTLASTPNMVPVSAFIYMVVAIFLLNFILQVDKKIGPGNLLRLITGKYHQPKVENQIFLFLDLKDSTSVAETLGHQTYSQLLQNCFHDLTDVVIRYKADIYQYVGDEVVLNWNVREGLADLNCINIFFAYQQQLRSRKDFYLSHYQVVPEFKGGMDMGLVTVAEVGDIKRDIAYHGNVLNTASRIQGQCKVFQKELLISETLERHVLPLNGFKQEKIGVVQLRGKEKAVTIYSLELVHKPT